MKLKDFETGIMAYAETCVKPHLSSQLDKILMYIALTAELAVMDRTVRQYGDYLHHINLLTDDCEVNLDALEDYCRAALKAEPKFKIWKLTFTESDLDDFMKHMRQVQSKQPQPSQMLAPKPTPQPITHPIAPNPIPQQTITH